MFAVAAIEEVALAGKGEGSPALQERFDQWTRSPGEMKLDAVAAPR